MCRTQSTQTGSRERVDIAVESKSSKELNQDAGTVYLGQHCSAVAIADGVGSSFDAHIAAELAVRVFLAGVEELDQQAIVMDVCAVRQLWGRVAQELRSYYTQHPIHYRERPTALQTTLATVIELEERYLISYLGNGSLFHIRGDFWSFWDRRWPWCITDLMLGHSFLGDTGKDVLYGIIAPIGLTAGVRFLELWKDKEYGDLLVLCSDGISSPDHLRIGRDANDKLWIEVNPYLDALLNQFLKPYFAQLGQQVDTRAMLMQTLDMFLKAQTFNDDATLGIVISRQARDYYLAQHPGTTA